VQRQGRGSGDNQGSRSHLLSTREWQNWSGRAAWLALASIQLRDSAGLAPASPLGLPIRGAGTLTNIQLFEYCKRGGSIRQSKGRGGFDNSCPPRMLGIAVMASIWGIRCYNRAKNESRKRAGAIRGTSPHSLPSIEQSMNRRGKVFVPHNKSCKTPGLSRQNTGTLCEERPSPRVSSNL